MATSPKAFCNILNVFTTEIWHRKHNLMAHFCSTNSDIVDLEKITFSETEDEKAVLSLS